MMRRMLASVARWWARAMPASVLRSVTGEGCVALEDGGGEEFFGVGGAAEEGVVGGDLEFGKSHCLRQGALPLDPITRKRAAHDGDKSPDPMTLRVQ